ncbi:MAG: hypothetical protein ACAH83_01695 [Alphaproteobacteria bacterium]
MAETHKSKLTREFCRANRVAFQPETPEEAVFIQERLAEFGIGWVDGAGPDVRAKDCTQWGMVVENGRLYFGPSSNPRDVLCTAAQFDKDYVSPDQAFLLEQFGKIAARLDDISSRLAETERKVAEIHDTMFPKVENTKPSLRRLP